MENLVRIAKKIRKTEIVLWSYSPRLKDKYKRNKSSSFNRKIWLQICDEVPMVEKL